jgi:D-mannonate dehydratase
MRTQRSSKLTLTITGTDWPYCTQGIVVGISDKDGIYELRKDSENQVVFTSHTPSQSSTWSEDAAEKQKELLEEYGLDIGPVQRMVHVHMLLGKYHGILVFEIC